MVKYEQDSLLIVSLLEIGGEMGDSFLVLVLFQEVQVIDQVLSDRFTLAVEDVSGLKETEDAVVDDGQPVETVSFKHFLALFEVQKYLKTGEYLVAGDGSEELAGGRNADNAADKLSLQVAQIVLSANRVGDSLPGAAVRTLLQAGVYTLLLTFVAVKPYGFLLDEADDTCIQVVALCPEQPLRDCRHEVVDIEA